MICYNAFNALHFVLFPLCSRESNHNADKNKNCQRGKIVISVDLWTAVEQYSVALQSYFELLPTLKIASRDYDESVVKLSDYSNSDRELSDSDNNS